MLYIIPNQRLSFILPSLFSAQPLYFCFLSKLGAMLSIALNISLQELFTLVQAGMSFNYSVDNFVAEPYWNYIILFMCLALVGKCF